jgi:hypothetical protein
MGQTASHDIQGVGARRAVPLRRDRHVIIHGNELNQIGTPMPRDFLNRR